MNQLTQSRKEREKVHTIRVRDFISSLDQITILDDEEEEVIDEYPKLDEKIVNFVRQALNGGSRTDVIMHYRFIIQLLWLFFFHLF